MYLQPLFLIIFFIILVSYLLRTRINQNPNKYIQGNIKKTAHGMVFYKIKYNSAALVEIIQITFFVKLIIHIAGAAASCRRRVVSCRVVPRRPAITYRD